MMKKVEIILLALAVVGLLLSIFLIPGGSTALVLSLSCLSMLYFYFGFALFNGIKFRGVFKKASYTNIKPLRILGAVGTGFAMSMALIGILFEAMAWPGNDIMLLYGMIMLVAIGVAVIVKYAAGKEDYYKNILFYILPVGVVAGACFFYGGEIFYEFKYREYPEMLEAYHKAKDHPYDEQLWMKVEEERRKINAVE